MTTPRLLTAAIAGALSVFAVAAQACSSCGCTLSSDWTSQGFATHEGLRLDLRHDYFHQNQLRTGTGTVDRGGIALPADQEVQLSTLNRNTTATLDYAPNANWGLTLMVPYFDRPHTTIAQGDTDISSSHSRGLGDVRVLGRYQGFTPEHDFGVQVGLKLATGATHDRFSSGPQAGETVDRGLQLGTGTTDLLLGVYKFGPLTADFDYFTQAMLQLPLNSHEDFRPGAGLNVSVGVRYMALERVVPHVQINIRAERRESGANADVPNSGAVLAYLSPGLSYSFSKHLSAYTFVQIPLYQDVRGFQIEPRYAVSVGLQWAM